MRTKLTPVERVLMRSVCDLRTRCWLCSYRRPQDGYARLSVSLRQTLAHRLVYEALVGPIPDQCDIDHLCRIRHCCNPAHLEPVPHRVNVLRGLGHAAANAAKTHCVHGHELTPENTYRRGAHRTCRECHRIWHRKGGGTKRGIAI